VQALYQIELSGGAVDAVVGEFVRHRLGNEDEGDNFGEVDQTLFGDVVRGTMARKADLDGMISAALSAEWPLERLEVILRAILRVGAYELFARPDVPARVVISEYLDIAHAFFAGKEPGLVNGVLDRLARTLRPQEVQEQGRGGA
jgi:N utilization substance protein B